MEKLVAKAKLRDITVSEFREPDIDDALTAIALEPSRLSKKIGNIKALKKLALLDGISTSELVKILKNEYIN